MHSLYADSLVTRDAIRRGEVSARELVATALEAAESESALGAFISLNPDLALQEADEADRLIAATPRDTRNYLPPLLGLPTAHKDLLRVRGTRTTHGSAAVAHLVAKADDPVVSAVRAAGAISIGKTQVPEFGVAGYSENLISPPARNPHDPARTAGGSSGGTAAAVAAEMIPAAIGSDAGGSIRIPSAACGLVGLKPGRGIVPSDALLGEVDDLGAPRAGVSGPIATTALDAALWFDAITQVDAAGAAVGLAASSLTAAVRSSGARDDAEPTVELVRRAAELRGLRIGVSLASPFDSRFPIHIDTTAHAALSWARARLEVSGHFVEDASIDYGTDYPEAFATVWTQSLRHIAFAPGAEERLGALTRFFLREAREAGSARIAQAVAQLHAFAQRARAQWRRYDAVLTPILAFEPPLIGAFWEPGPEGDYQLQCEWTPHTSMVNIAGEAAVAVPVSAVADANGLPRGIQLITRRGAEGRLLQLAAQLTA